MYDLSPESKYLKLLSYLNHLYYNKTIYHDTACNRNDVKGHLTSEQNYPVTIDTLFYIQPVSQDKLFKIVIQSKSRLL